MAFEPDLLVDRRRLKRGLAFWRIATIVALVALVLVGAWRVSGFHVENHIARLEVDGIILNDRDRLDAIERVAADRHAKALIVAIDSPGGTVVGGEALFKALRGVAAKKPVVAVMDEVAASGGYMVALGADQIFAHESTITGSIGVLFQTTEITGLLSKLGISAEAIKSGPLKAAPSPVEPMTPEVRRVTQQVVDDIYDMFVRMTAERRKLSPERARTLADGRVYTGRQAVANGLIDRIGGEGEATAWLEKERGVPSGLPVHPVVIERGLGELLQRFDSLARKTVFSERLTLDGVISLWHPDLR
jgi:protease-4